jgi:hypothetical protein
MNRLVILAAVVSIAFSAVLLMPAPAAAFFDINVTLDGLKDVAKAIDKANEMAGKELPKMRESLDDARRAIDKLPQEIREQLGQVVLDLDLVRLNAGVEVRFNTDFALTRMKEGIAQATEVVRLMKAENIHDFNTGLVKLGRTSLGPKRKGVISPVSPDHIALIYKDAFRCSPEPESVAVGGYDIRQGEFSCLVLDGEKKAVRDASRYLSATNGYQLLLDISATGLLFQEGDKYLRITNGSATGTVLLAITHGAKPRNPLCGSWSWDTPGPNKESLIYPHPAAGPLDNLAVVVSSQIGGEAGGRFDPSTLTLTLCTGDKATLEKVDGVTFLKWANNGQVWRKKNP